MQMSFVMIGRAEAAELLRATHPRQRSIRASRVSELAAAMMCGEFVSTHQGIAIDVDGYLVDGQHRLAAVVSSGCTVGMWVATGVPRAVLEAIDRGGVRTVAECLQIGGKVDAGKDEVAVARTMMSAPGFGRSKPSVAEIGGFLREYQAAVAFAVESVCGLVRHSGLRGAVGRAFRCSDAMRLRFFCRVISGEVPESFDNATDGSALLLKDWMIFNRKMLTGEPGRAAVYRKSQRAIRAFLDGERLRSLRECREDLFPL